MFGKNKINDSAVMKFGFLGGMAEAAYILAVVLFMTTVGPMMPKKADGLIAPLLFLLLFVFSAAISAIFVFGYPAYQAAKKKYAEALMTVCTTLATLAIIGILLFIYICLI